MSEVKFTSGYNFEGYEITEYLGFVTGQTVNGANFFKGLAAGITEMSDEESEKLILICILQKALNSKYKGHI